jgi:methyl-accepting chemotaxis protein
MKQINLPRRFAGLLVGFGAVTVLTMAAFALLLRGSIASSTAVTSRATAQLSQSYALLEMLTASHGDLQRIMKIKDPDEIETAVNALKEQQKKTSALIAGAGAGDLKAKYDAMLAGEDEVMGSFLQGDISGAYEKFFGPASTRYEAVLAELRQQRDRVEKAASATLEEHRVQALRAMWWQIAALALGLALLLAIGFWLRVQIVREMRRISGVLSDTCQQFIHASGQISSSSQTLAEGASEQAASIEETSASLEELSSMTKRNAGNAQKANDLAKQARMAADRGVNDMQSMSDAMEAIKASSDDIAKIIKTIDEIAFQTNILALNAAVEAARAGEAGMGFAVVADEVRNLAQRSAQAAKETASKIEGAIGNSAQGVSISSKVAETLNDIVGKARQVDELVAEVASASREQSQGIIQINSAVGQMDKVTQSNAANAEESAAASQQLNAQSDVLRQSVQELLALAGQRGMIEDEPSAAPPVSRPPRSPRASHAPRHATPAPSPASDGDLIQWDEARMSTGVESVDDQHQELIRMINELHRACRAGAGKDEMRRMMAFLGEYVNTHFKHEEGVMEQRQCPNRAKNKAAHLQFLNSFQKLVADFESKGASTSILLDLRQMVGDWLVNHICGIDTKLRDCGAACPNRHAANAF